MPWKNVSPMEQKQRFVSLAGSGHFSMTELCRDFGVSRKTGHNWVARYAEGGMKALEERSRAPQTTTCRTSDEVERLICTEKRLRSTWGPKKIRQVLMTKHGVKRSRRQHGGQVLSGTAWSPNAGAGRGFQGERGTLTAPGAEPRVRGRFQGMVSNGRRQAL
jgi:transposase